MLRSCHEDDSAYFGNGMTWIEDMEIERPVNHGGMFNMPWKTPNCRETD
jgi:hypothetical protein